MILSVLSHYICIAGADACNRWLAPVHAMAGAMSEESGAFDDRRSDGKDGLRTACRSLCWSSAYFRL